MLDQGFGDGTGLHLVTSPEDCDTVVYLLKIW